jgi:RNA polymerase sigma-70 factor (ECF subfamily)
MLAMNPINEPAHIDKSQEISGRDNLGVEALHPVALPTPPDPAQQVNWTGLVQRIQINDQQALEELYTLFSRGIKFLIVRQLGRQDIDDRVHDTFVIVVQAIQRGDLRDPERLMGFVRTIVRRQIASFIEKNYTRRRDELDIDGTIKIADGQSSPEEVAIQTQNAQIMDEILQDCSRRDREILTRFYLLEQPQEQICAEMDLNETQFRLLKSRAKQRFSDEGRRRMAKNNLKSFFVRKRSAS